ncbi:hypothetical protein MLD38_019803 [Melastoma candidum]|uniref:Uncharacterized protein n=1 Tax=Melastoma candidum TaxID=119954 RepID=A0ACB9QIX1_9MYRT|nr:hypothetical protein MLD38_019803 [Melastoma candidum]
MDKDKEQFLKEFGADYGYPDGPKSVDDIRATEFKRLQDGIVYLDHAGATLYSELQMEAIFKDLSTTLYANPHSQSDAGMTTSDIVREAREQVLDYCNASPMDYRCIFTSGATASLKLVGESFPWTYRSCFMYSVENHNSVLGIREYALQQGASACAIDIENPDNSCTGSLKITRHPLQRRCFLNDKAPGGACSLLAIPSECNFSGTKLSTDHVIAVKEDFRRQIEGHNYHRLDNHKLLVLVDAAKGCATEKLDLRSCDIDFVVISFYKMFGYPTGLGALIVKNDAAKLLRKTYFGGGTVDAVIADVDFVKRREGIEEWFEDGSISFLSIASIRHGFTILKSLTPGAISRHTKALCTFLRRTLLDLRHENGTFVCTIYGSQNPKNVGPIVTFNLKRPDGSWHGYREVEKLAALSGIQLRTGCFCNPGACAKYLGLTHQDILSNLEAGHVCWDDCDLVDGRPTGAVRVSFGYMSTYEDLKKFVDFIRSSFVSVHIRPHASKETMHDALASSVSGPRNVPLEPRFFVNSINIYPIKSCSGFQKESWPLSSTGFLYDREWLLKSLAGEVLTQKKVPEMCLLSAFIDLEQEVLIVESPQCKEKLEIKIKHGLHGYDDSVNVWFSTAIGRPCYLVRRSKSDNRSCLKRKNGHAICRESKDGLNFVNEGQFLLVTEESVRDLNNRINSGHEASPARGSSTQIGPDRFRPNLVICGGHPYAEDTWKMLRIGREPFTSLGGCNRCQMINFRCEGGRVRKSSEPLATLASYRRVKGKILFGILLTYEIPGDFENGNYPLLHIGDEVYPDEFSTVVDKS